MFEIFIALFGGLFYLAKILGEKSADRRTDALNRKRKLTADEWIDKMTDKDVEAEVRRFVYHTQNTQKVLDVVQEYYDTVLQKWDFEDLYPSWKWPSGKKYTREYMIECAPYDKHRAMWIFMAKRGLLPQIDAFNVYTTMTFYTRLDLEIFRLCVEELKKHGVEEEFVATDSDWGVNGKAHWEI